MPVSKILGVVLLVITFSLGILLAVTIGERNTAETALSNAQATLKDKDKALKEEKDAKDQATSDFSGCRTQLEKLNKEAADQALASVQDTKAADARVNETLAGLPAAIAKDRQPLITGQGPAQATLWMKELFK